MHWNYRILRHPDENGEEVYGLHEVHYDDLGKEVAWSEEPILAGESVKDLEDGLGLAAAAFARAVFDVRDRKRT